MKNFINLHILKKTYKAFTLVEVLVTIAVIGIVAAMTIPPLMTKINSKVKEHQIKVIEKRFLTGLNLFNSQENGLSGKVFTSTEEFVKGLSKHYKIISICNSNEMNKCLQYNSIKDDDRSLDLTNNVTAKDLGLKNENYYSPAAFVNGAGVPFIIALKKNCVVDVDTTMKSIQDGGCVALLYDLNGNKAPNEVTKDIISLGGMNIKGYMVEINGVKITEGFQPEMITKEQCAEEVAKADEYGEYAIKECYPYGLDSWAGAMAHCHNNGSHLITHEELIKVLPGFYKNSQGKAYVWETDDYDSSIHIGVSKFGYTPDCDLINSIGLRVQGEFLCNDTNMGWPAVYIWSSQERDYAHASRGHIAHTYFSASKTSNDNARKTKTMNGLCVRND